MPKHSFLSGRAFDSGVAALAALSAGFVAFAMPDPLFTGLVETSRLPEFLAAAEPPLGQKARLAAAGAAALLTFAAVWALMTALGRIPARSKARPEARAEAEAEPPRLRRADAHPDAPARRPLLARDLGEPLDLDAFAEAPAEEAPLSETGDRPLPAFLVPQAPEPEPVAEAEPERTDSEPSCSGGERAEVAWALEEPEAPETFEWEPEPQPEPKVEARREAEPAPPPISQLAAQLPEAGEESEQPLSQLVNRIEFGLSRKRQALPASPDVPQAEDSPVDQERVGHRLRSAINDLQKIASSGA